MIFVNFKTYEQGTGENAISLVGILEKVAQNTHVKVIPTVQAADLKEVIQASKLEVWVQRIDPVSFGAHTGAILAEAVKEDGASGTFLNHSETKFKTLDELKEAVKRAKEVALKTLIFASTLNELKKVLSLKPTFVAYEPPELIGSRDTSVARAKPEIIEKAAKVAKEKGTPLIVGAGIHDREDVAKSVSLGAVGVAVATDVVKAKNPERELMDLIAGFTG